MNTDTIKNIFLEEYEKRMLSFLIESNSIPLETSYGVNVWENADQFKVRHKKTNLEFTFSKFIEGKVKLFLPEESRFDSESKSIEKVLSEYGIELDKEEKDRKYILIDIDIFKKDFYI